MQSIRSATAARHSIKAVKQPPLLPVTKQFSTTSPTHLPQWALISSAVKYGFLAAASYGIYGAYAWRHPRVQAPMDPDKKTVVVLGSGWASTSFIKKLDTRYYNLVVVSPRNYFLFTPLLPSSTVGTVNMKSIIEPIRFITRHKKRAVQVYEAECTAVDPASKTITIEDHTPEKDHHPVKSLTYDYLVIGVGARNSTFGVPGVDKYGCFLKEAKDARKIHNKLMDCVENAALPHQSPEEVNRLLHMVVVGGGATGIEYAAELHDFLVDDLRTWYPDLADKIKISLIEALPNVLPQFSKQLIEYTEKNFQKQHITIHTKTQVKEVRPKEIVVKKADDSVTTMPYGLLVWATGNTTAALVQKLKEQFPEEQTAKKGLAVDDWLKLKGCEDIYAFGDATHTQYAPTGQVASQQGKYLAHQFKQMFIRDALEAQLKKAQDEKEKEKIQKKLDHIKEIKPFQYTHHGSLCYVGSEKAIADLPLGPLGHLASGGAGVLFLYLKFSLT
ncbi:Putative NADH dehydrogenase [Rhizopus microsporus]|nr:Putative NADH dehydrogenase [Rhizopus microsporus]